MQWRLITGITILLAFASVAGAEDEDYLRRGERKRTYTEDVAYERALRHVLSRAWRSDVVLRIVAKPSFDREWAVGISRGPKGCTAFVTIVAPPDSIWYTLGFGAAKPNPDRLAYRRLKRILIEKPIPEQTAARVAALWRGVLTNPRNYRQDPHMREGTDAFTYFLAFAPREQFTAWTPSWDSSTLQLIKLGYALAAYAEGIDNERKLIKAIAKAEREIGI